MRAFLIWSVLITHQARRPLMALPIFLAHTQLIFLSVASRTSFFERYLKKSATSHKPPSITPMPAAPLGMVTYATVPDGWCFWRSVVAALTAAGKLTGAAADTCTAIDNVRLAVALFFIENLDSLLGDFEKFVLSLFPDTTGVAAVEVAKMQAFAPLRTNGTPVVLGGDTPRWKAVEYAILIVKGVWGSEFEASLVAKRFGVDVHMYSACTPQSGSNGPFADVPARPTGKTHFYKVVHKAPQHITQPAQIHIGNNSNHFCVYLLESFPLSALPKGMGILQAPDPEGAFVTVIRRGGSKPSRGSAATGPLGQGASPPPQKGSHDAGRTATSPVAARSAAAQPMSFLAAVLGEGNSTACAPKASPSRATSTGSTGAAWPERARNGDTRAGKASAAAQSVGAVLGTLVTESAGAPKGQRRLLAAGGILPAADVAPLAAAAAVAVAAALPPATAAAAETSVNVTAVRTSAARATPAAACAAPAPDPACTISSVASTSASTPVHTRAKAAAQSPLRVGRASAVEVAAAAECVEAAPGGGRVPTASSISGTVASAAATAAAAAAVAGAASAAAAHAASGPAVVGTIPLFDTARGAAAPSTPPSAVVSASEALAATGPAAANFATQPEEAAIAAESTLKVKGATTDAAQEEADAKARAEAQSKASAVENSKATRKYDTVPLWLARLRFLSFALKVNCKATDMSMRPENVTS